MAALQRRDFLARKIRERIRRDDDYDVFLARIRDEAASDTSGDSDQTVRYRAIVAVGRRMLGDDAIAKIERSWEKRKDGYRRRSLQERTWAAQRRLTLTAESLMLAVEREKARDAQLREAEKAERELEKLAQKEQKAKIRLAERRVKRIEAREAASEARRIYYEQQRKIMEQEAERQEQVRIETAHAKQSMVFDPNQKDEKVDIVAATAWVLQNLPQLVLVSDTGVRKLNPALMEAAPSNTARAVAMYAMEDHARFMDKYAIRLFPKDTTEKEVDLDDEAKKRQEALDPSFGELSKYFEG